MADDENEIVETPKKKPLLIYIVIGLVVVLTLAGGTAYFVSTRHLFGDAKTVQREPGFMMKLGDAQEGIIVNIGTPSSGRYLKIGIILELKPDKKTQSQAGKTMTPEEIKINDAVLHVLRSQRVDDFDPQKQDRLKEMIRQEVDRVMGREVVYDVYITNILLQ